MSSLLDILHRRDTRQDQELPADPPADAEAQPTVELRLAIDNGPLEATAEATTDFSLAADPDASNTPAAPAPGSDPFATFASRSGNPMPAGEATQLLTATQLRGRSRRSTAWLGAGIALIVLGAGLATWLLNETSGFGPDEDSQFTAPGPGSGPVERPAPAAAMATPEAGTPEPALTRGTSPPERTTERVTSTPVSPKDAGDSDTAWFDTPAVEDSAAGSSTTGSEQIRIVRGTTSNPLFTKINEAWTAFQAADYARAETLYREVRAADAGNVDALLGLGALAARGNRVDEAREFYQAVLLAEPKNSTAVSALSTLPSSGTRNLDESTLKGLLREQPGAANLHFALGLQYVAQGRWPDAQLAFFDAVRNEPTNADYAYNLAVSLDQLGQSAPAAAYYQRALELANASALFSTAAAEQRLATLRSPAP